MIAYENMAAFFDAQLDFIFFFYGLAFILFGTVSFAIARIKGAKASGPCSDCLHSSMAPASGWI